MTTDRLVDEVLERLSFDELEGSLDDTIKKLKSLRDAYPGKVVRLDVQSQRYTDDKEYAVVWRRPENEEEAAKRLAQDHSSKEYRRQQFESLKKEFGG